MMEKYGASTSTYEVVVPDPKRPDDFTAKATGLSLDEAKDVQKQNPTSIIRPE